MCVETSSQTRGMSMRRDKTSVRVFLCVFAHVRSRESLLEAPSNYSFVEKALEIPV